MEMKTKAKPKLPKAEIRYLDDLKKVLCDQKWSKTAPNLELYYIYRGLKEKKDIRYDITIILPKMLGKEFAKTKGHYHFGSYGELYKVLKGEAIFLMQKKKNKLIDDVYYVRAKSGDYIAIAPFYGHVIINSSDQPLKIANWISPNCKADYESIERKAGFSYYYTNRGWLKNKNYKKVLKLKAKKALKKPPKNLDFIYGSN